MGNIVFKFMIIVISLLLFALGYLTTDDDTCFENNEPTKQFARSSLTIAAVAIAIVITTIVT